MRGTEEGGCEGWLYFKDFSAMGNMVDPIELGRDRGRLKKVTGGPSSD